MIIYRSSFAIKKKLKSPVVAIGNFDGVHLGHQKILKEVVRKAKKIGGSAVVYTLYPPPARVLRPQTNITQILTLQDRLEKIKELGINIVVIEKFSRRFSKKSATEFFNQIILKNLNTKILYVGSNFFFGKNREGNVHLLKKKCEEKKIEFHVVQPHKKGGEIISSTKIRTLISDGDVKKAALFLGYPYFLRGKVVHGEKRGLGIPTATLKTKAELIPREGVYATQTEFRGLRYKSATSIGRAITFSEDAPFAIETHLIGFKQSLYGKSLTIHFLNRIRDMQKFSSIEKLTAKMREDIQKAQSACASFSEGK